jgi:UDP-2-acetamido-3-amino-2,3-dideoxy-glucuronate N-acetyltransferase
MSGIRVVVVGTGYWGKNLVRNFAALGVLHAVCDADFSCAQAMSTSFGCKAMLWDDVLSSGEVDAVVIAVPAVLHFQMADQALEAGKHVYVEKPLALKVDNAKKLVGKACKLQRILMVGHLLRYHPVFMALKERVVSGAVGDLQYLYSNRLNFGKIRREEDILWSFAPHDISMILSLVGERPKEVTAYGGYYLHESIADVTTTHLTFSGGTKAHIHVSWLHPYKEQKLVVIGNKGMFVFDDGESWENKLAFYPHQVDLSEGVPVVHKAEAEYIQVKEEEPLRNECAHFIESIVNKTTPRTDGAEGIRVLEVLDKASQSLAKGGGSTSKSSRLKHTSAYYVHPSSCVDDGVMIGRGSKIWHYTHLMKGVQLGESCVVGQNVSIGPAVRIGDHCKIQNNVSLYEGVTLEDGVFCGPSCVFTNVCHPRSEIEKKDEFKETYVEKGATIGANATIVCGVRLGKYCFVGAAAVITKDVPAYALMVGSPARQVGWVGRFGEKLSKDLKCPREGRQYHLLDGVLTPLEKEEHHAT